MPRWPKFSTSSTSHKYPLMPAYKALLAHLVDDDAWIAVRAPLVPLASQDRDAMIERLRKAGVISA
jgi:hypothetical protein